MKKAAFHATSMLALLVALMLDVQITWATDDLPPLPRAWVVLWQTTPHLAQAWQEHGITTGVAFTGLFALSLMQALLWVAFLIICWHFGKQVGMQMLRMLSMGSMRQQPIVGPLPTIAIPLLPTEAGATPTPTPILPAASTANTVNTANLSTPCLAVPTHSSPPCVQAGAGAMSVPVTLEAASRVASAPWLACQSAIREGVMHNADGALHLPYLACFVVEGCGSRSTTGDAVCERVLDAATETLARLLTQAGRDAVEPALQASIIEANHILVQQNEARGTYLSASLVACLVTSQDIWASATGHTHCMVRQAGRWKDTSDADHDLVLGEEDLALEGSLALSHYPFATTDAILLGAGSAWREQGIYIASTWTYDEEEIEAQTRYQHLVEQATTSTTSAVAGLLMVRAGPSPSREPPAVLAPRSQSVPDSRSR
jgi:hypothetical protein